jgi:hypothetical protein
MSPEAMRTAVLAQLGVTKPATDGLLQQIAASVHDVREHDHPKWEDLYCSNLVSWMGERMAPVLRRLLDAEDRVAELEASSATARRRGYEAAIDVMRQERLPMSVGLLEAQLELDELDGAAEAGKDTREGESTHAEPGPVCPVCHKPPCHCSCFGKTRDPRCPHGDASEAGGCR